MLADPESAVRIFYYICLCAMPIFFSYFDFSWTLLVESMELRKQSVSGKKVLFPFLYGKNYENEGSVHCQEKW